MATFSKVTFDTADTDHSYGDYQEVLEETARVQDDFTINTLKNTNKNYKRRTTLKIKGYAQILLVRPDRCEDDPPPGDWSAHASERATIECYKDLVVDRAIYVKVEPERKVVELEQVPFVLATKGVIFRQRGTPHFTTIGRPENYTN